ncbi:hypothetical protein [Faecalicoccus acidiformans]|uniref:hypothetical protein n=1 Tax=Faecalicoccus acidiformans TaxID=915173 RepID=UPI0023557B5C|nr:hypothetical protein [Faecalicoccus acidiformans]
MLGYTLAFKLVGVFFLCRFKIKLGFQKWRYSLDKISMFDSIKKQGRNRNKYKENQEENIKNLTKNYLDMKR